MELSFFAFRSVNDCGSVDIISGYLHSTVKSSHLVKLLTYTNHRVNIEFIFIYPQFNNNNHY